jgi:hypothetical protein
MVRDGHKYAFNPQKIRFQSTLRPARPSLDGFIRYLRYNPFLIRSIESMLDPFHVIGYKLSAGDFQAPTPGSIYYRRP